MKTTLGLLLLSSVFPVFAADTASLSVSDPATNPASDAKASADFGRSAANPIRVVEVDAEYAYLRRLKTPLFDKPVRALRWGSFYADGFDGPMDRWSVEELPGSFVDVYFYPYSETNTLVAPNGFFLFDPEGAEEDFSLFAPARPAPREENEPETDSVSDETAEGERGQPVFVGSVKIPPPRGFVAVDPSSDEFAALEEEWKERADPSTHVAAAFVRSPASSCDGNAALVVDLPKPVPLSFFESVRASFLDDLYSKGPRSGTFAPHRNTDRSLQWTMRYSAAGFPEEDETTGPSLVVESAGLLWIGGHMLTISLPGEFVLEKDFRMTHVERSRKRLEDWEDEILRVNDAGPAAADGRRGFASAPWPGPAVARTPVSRSLPLVPVNRPRQTDWWKGRNGFAVKMALKAGLPLLAVAVAILLGRARNRRKTRKYSLERYDLLPYGSMIRMPCNNGTMPVAPWSADGGLSFEWFGGSPPSEVLVLFQWEPKTAIEKNLSFRPKSEWSEDDRNRMQLLKTNQFRYVASVSLYQMLGSHCPLRILTLERSSATPVPLFCEWRADARNGRCVHGLYSGSEKEKDVLDFFLRLLTNGKPENMSRIGTVAEGWERKCDLETALNQPSFAKEAEPEFCPTCGGELVDGICPNGCELKLVRSETGGSGE